MFPGKSTKQGVGWKHCQEDLREDSISLEVFTGGWSGSNYEKTVERTNNTNPGDAEEKFLQAMQMF